MGGGGGFLSRHVDWCMRGEMKKKKLLRGDGSATFSPFSFIPRVSSRAHLASMGSSSQLGV